MDTIRGFRKRHHNIANSRQKPGDIKFKANSVKFIYDIGMEGFCDKAVCCTDNKPSFVRKSTELF